MAAITRPAPEWLKWGKNALADITASLDDEAVTMHLFGTIITDYIACKPSGTDGKACSSINTLLFWPYKYAHSIQP